MTSETILEKLKTAITFVLYFTGKEEWKLEVEIGVLYIGIQMLLIIE